MKKGDRVIIKSMCCVLSGYEGIIVDFKVKNNVKNAVVMGDDSSTVTAPLILWELVN